MKAKIVQVHYKYVYGRNVAYAKLVQDDDITEQLLADSLSRVLMHVKENDVEVTNAQEVLSQLVLIMGCGA
jgi:hypothetical protein